MLHGLERADRLAELLPRFGVFDRVFENPLHPAEHVGADEQRADLHRTCQRSAGRVADSQHALGADRDLLEGDVAEFARLIQAGGRRDRQRPQDLAGTAIRARSSPARATQTITSATAASETNDLRPLS